MLLLGFLQTTALALQNVATPATTSASISIEEEVLSNLRNQPIGEHQTVADLQLPDPFLRVVADRVIRSSFEQRYRMVVSDMTAANAPATGTGVPGASHHGSVNRWYGLVLLLPVIIGAFILFRRRGNAAR